jgi:hypothetical protein
MEPDRRLASSPPPRRRESSSAGSNATSSASSRPSPSPSSTRWPDARHLRVHPQGGLRLPGARSRIKRHRVGLEHRDRPGELPSRPDEGVDVGGAPGTRVTPRPAFCPTGGAPARIARSQPCRRGPRPPPRARPAGSAPDVLLGRRRTRCGLRASAAATWRCSATSPGARSHRRPARSRPPSRRALRCRERPVQHPALPRKEEQALARFWLTPTARFGQPAPVARRAHSSRAIVATSPHRTSATATKRTSAIPGCEPGAEQTDARRLRPEPVLLARIGSRLGVPARARRGSRSGSSKH